MCGELEERLAEVLSAAENTIIQPLSIVQAMHLQAQTHSEPILKPDFVFMGFLSA